jgi:hypothetical protein
LACGFRIGVFGECELVPLLILEDNAGPLALDGGLGSGDGSDHLAGLTAVQREGLIRPAANQRCWVVGRDSDVPVGAFGNGLAVLAREWQLNRGSVHNGRHGGSVS